jgi:hypothetical protein
MCALLELCGACIVSGPEKWQTALFVLLFVSWENALEKLAIKEKEKKKQYSVPAVTEEMKYLD